MRATILAGGRGTRLAPYTMVFPKPLMPIGGMPILEIVVRQLAHHGFTEVTMAVGHLAELIETFFGDGARFGLKITYSREREPLGTAGPLGLIKDLDEPFLVMNGDLLTTVDFSGLARFHRSHDGIASIGLYEKTVKIDLGIVETDEENLVSGYLEKPTLKHWVSMGIYMFDPRVLSYVPEGVRLDLPELILKLVEAGEKSVAYRFQGRWLDIGRPEDYHEAAEIFEARRQEFCPAFPPAARMRAA
ncbi:NTP transferase domain-containing protein [Geomonas sp. RF6]|uniref:nucleotidyltransferase family protein n=1 Tax=Geomonas sp. RF6 TaxID=2897342 RepID=UPI001E45C40B|nr:sugar phosphate nucleotidyltransferase [Geomonas sp. RF6]UFS69347.1 NTP transferase domain-containing protein [Geomonas sp. RF6]